MANTSPTHTGLRSAPALGIRRRHEVQATKASWLRSAAFIGLLMGLLVLLAGCESPCQRLSERLCASRGVKGEQCTAWEERTQRVTPETCEAALRMLDRERIR